jgi:tape measure domain-containing protein
MSANLGIKIGVEGTAQAEGAMRQMSGAMQQLGTATEKTRAEMQAAKAAFENWNANNSGMPRLNDQIKQVGQSLGALAAGFIGFQGAQALVGAADAVTMLGNKLRLATGDAKVATEAYTQILEIANRSKVSFTELGNTYAAISRNTQQLGVSQERLFKVTESIANAMAVSGGSAQSMQAALVQLGQGMASGTLRGEELNSVMEQTPRLAQALADGMGVTIGQLREMGQAGKITSQAVVEALESQYDKLRKEVSESAVTIGQSYQALKNSLTDFAGALDAVNQTSSSFADAILMSGRAVGDFSTILRAMGAAGKDASKDLGFLTTIQEGLAIAFETIAVLGVNLKFVLVSVGREIGGIAAQAAALATGNFSEVAAIGREMRADAAAARAEVDRQTAAILSARAVRDSLVNAKTYDEPRFEKMLRAETDELKRQQPIVAQTAAEKVKAAKELADAMATYQGLMAKESGLSASFAGDWDKISLAYTKGKITADQLLEAQRVLLDQQPLMVAAKKEQAELDKKNAADTAKFFDDSLKAQAAAVNAADKSIEATKKQAAAERQAMASIGLTKEAIAELTVAKYEDAAASKDRLANIMAEAGEPELLIQKYREEAKALRDLAKAKRERGAAETAQDLGDASQKAAEKAATDWQRASDRIEDSITNALMRGFESGKGFAQTLKDTVINMFKTMVLRPVIQAVVGGVGGLSGAAASAGGGGGSALSGASSLLGLSGTMSTFGSYMATGFMNTVAGSGFAASMGAAGGLASSGAVAGGAGMAVGAAIPYVAAALAVANVLGLMRSNRTVGGGLMGTLGEGDIQAYDLNRRGGTLLSGPSYSIQNVRESDQSKAIQDAFVAMRSATAGMATQLGLANDSIIGFTTQLGKDLIHPDTGGYGIKLDGLNPEQAAAKVQEALATANEEMARQLLGTFESTAEKYMREVELYFDSESGAAVMGREEATRQGSDRWVAGEFVREGETAAQALQRLAGSLTAVNNVLGTLDQSLMATSLAGGDAASKLIDAFGGLENFTASTASYYQNFYTETERNAKTTEQLTKSLSGLGLAMPDTIKGFRDLVGAQDLTTDAGRATYAALISLSPAFAQVTNAADAAALAIVNQRQGLQDQLDGLLGNTTALRERERNALDESNRALYDNIKALEDQATAAQAAAAIASERSGLQNQLDTLLGNTAALRERERDGLDESNRALYDKIKALEDQKAADAIAAQAAAEAQRAQEQAAQATAAAAQEAQRAAEQIKSAWQSIGDSIVSEINRIRGEVAGNTPTSFASAQAQFAIASAQARGGDQEAAKLLPSLSKAMLDLADLNATSALDLKRLQGQTAGSLAATLALINRQYGTTTSAELNLQDMAALSLVPVLQSDATQPQMAAVPTAAMPTLPTADQPQLFAGLVAEIQALRAQVAALQVAADSTADSTRKTKDLIQLVTRDGEAMQTEAAT